ncbi:hypothetical protein KZ829_17915 [Actinoplanes hulinensis]|uniref:Uncharacterized protein n=1 Tax=Actinoplanes hulinensis TaxID=1144547 RepID=A0ABS7B3S2_9ACTN|nr:hypothetical protein [Actinoplanes hulinensis]MBW6435620.1 hypothetical protein [Actinoplanes hulinensis]
MRFMANSRPADGITAGQLAEFFDEHGFSAAAWNLVRHRVVTEYALKVGDVPGIVLFLETESADEATAVLAGLTAVRQGLLTFDLDPIGKTMSLGVGS